MHPRAVEIAGRYDVPVRVRSTLTADEDGTLIARRTPTMEDPAIIGVASEGGYARLVLCGLPPEMPSMTGLLDRLTDVGVSVDLLSQVDGPDGRRTIQLTVRGPELEVARAECEAVVAERGGSEVAVKTGLARVTLVGSGMHKRPGVFARTFRVLELGGVSVHDVSASSTSIIVMVDARAEEDAVRLLHEGFGLGRA
jgi:aspartate kinase